MRLYELRVNLRSVGWSERNSCWAVERSRIARCAAFDDTRSIDLQLLELGIEWLATYYREW